MNTNNITARNAAIREALNAGRTYAEITSQFHVSSKTVSKIASGAEFGGKRGRPRALNDEMLRFIEEVSLADARVTDGEMVSLVHSRFDVTVSRSTVAAARNELGFRYRPPMTRQLLSETQVAERLEFSRAIINGEEQAPNIVFSDESRFEKEPRQHVEKDAKGLLERHVFRGEDEILAWCHGLGRNCRGLAESLVRLLRER